MGKKDKNEGKAASKGAKVTMPDGSEKNLNNGSSGFFRMNVAYFRCQESMMGKLPGGGIELRDREGLGQSSGKLPGGYNLSKNHSALAAALPASPASEAPEHASQSPKSDRSQHCQPKSLPLHQGLE